MVLADQWVNYYFYMFVILRGNKIQASCKRTHMAKVQRAIPLEKWGVIKNVQMNPAGGKYRTTRHPYKMAISDETVIRGSDLADDRIFLSLSNYESIEKTDKKRLYYIVIGRVHDLGDIITVKAQGEDRKMVEFRLVDSHLSADHLQLATVEKSTGKKDGKRIQYDWNDAEIKLISEIIDATQMTRIDNPKFHCEICNANVTNVSPKFKLHVIVKDDTETCRLMLLGSVATSIVGVEADDL
ncbi:unnamed protein product [Brassica oleracea]